MDDEPTQVPYMYIDTKENIRHVTIRQILGAGQMHETAPVTIEGVEVSSLMVVANIFNCQMEREDLWFSLDDGTGRMRCILKDWVKTDVFDHFAYVRAIVRPWSRARRFLEATHLVAITDPHEIFYHGLKVIEHSLIFQDRDGKRSTLGHQAEIAKDYTMPGPHTPVRGHRKPAPNANLASPTHGSQPNMSPASTSDDHSASQDYREDWFGSGPGISRTLSTATASSYHTAYSEGSSSPESPSRYHQTFASLSTPVAPTMPEPTRYRRIRDPYGHLSSLQRDIILCINEALEDTGPYTTPSDKPGVNIRVILQGLRARHGARLLEDDVASSMESLHDEGYIFTTIDDQHYNVIQMA